jgi:hypothetical protein
MPEEKGVTVMRGRLLAQGIVVLLVFLAAVQAPADPRIETNKTFCHFILSVENTDDEVFVAGCNSVITVRVPPPQAAGTKQANCENYVASGYIMLEKVLPQSQVPLTPGNSLTFTSADSDVPCTLVESNGREYRSHNWQSAVRVRKNHTNDFVTVQYELLCRDGTM